MDDAELLREYRIQPRSKQYEPFESPLALFDEDAI